MFRHHRRIDMLSLMLMLIGCSLLVACQRYYPPLTPDRDVADPDSPMLTALMQASDCVGDWRWSCNKTTQKKETPTAENYQLVEHAHLGLADDGGPERPDLMVVHNLFRYEQPSPPIDAVKPGVGSKPGDEVFGVAVPQLGLSRKAECVRTLEGDSHVLTCLMTIQYSHIISSLTLFAGDEIIDSKAVEDIVNPVLSNIDARIRQIDK